MRYQTVAAEAAAPKLWALSSQFPHTEMTHPSIIPPHMIHQNYHSSYKAHFTLWEEGKGYQTIDRCAVIGGFTILKSTYSKAG